MLWLVAVFVLLLAAVVYSLTLEPVQTFLAQKAAVYLSKELNTPIAIRRLHVKPFTLVTLEGLRVLDRQHDTLLNAGSLTVDVRNFSIARKRLTLQRITLKQSSVYFKEYVNGTSNLSFIINYFDKGEPAPGKKKQPWKIDFNEASLQNIHLRYRDYSSKPGAPGVDFANLDVKGLWGDFTGIDFNRNLFQSRIKGLRLSEQSGFKLDNFSGDAVVNNKFIEVKNLLIKTPLSHLARYYRMDFEQWKDFSDYVHKVRMTADFTDAHVAAKDVAFFAPELSKWHLQVDITGKAQGRVDDFKVKGLDLKAGKATWIKGDVTMKGLPDWRETFMDFKIAGAATTKAEFDEIISDVSGVRGSILPAEVGRLGNINFKGNFTGYQDDFVAYADFKTRLGAAKTDLNLRYDKRRVPYYSGNIITAGFDLGTLVSYKSLGRVTANLAVKGQGFTTAALNTSVKGKIAAVQYNGYNYRNIRVDGSLKRKVFAGDVAISDENLAGRFKGTINLNPALPVYNFAATVQKARLQRLHFAGQQLDIEADIRTNFSGTNLDNIIGSVQVNAVKIANKNGVFSVDSVYVTAVGKGSNRILKVESDILDASIRGTYDLRTLPAYYISVAKKYLPSLDNKKYSYRHQDFTFALNIKHFEPIGQVLNFSARVPDGATFLGTFNSAHNIATLNGIIRSLEYGKIKLENIIVDESINTNSLQAVVTTDRLMVNDSVSVENVNIANVLRNDSLLANVKLKTVGVGNELDLNALIQFLPGRPAQLSLLPSVIKVNNQDWQVAEKSAVSIHQGETTIQNLHFTNDSQNIYIDGVIGNKPTDKLQVKFGNFGIQTLNPFLKGFNLAVKGTLNGTTNLYSILGALRVDDNLTLDSLAFNNTLLGTLTEQSKYNPQTNTLDINTNIKNQQAKGLTITGAINTRAKTIDAHLTMDEAQLAVAEPFTNDLVSHLQGTINADMDVGGTFEKPLINGDIKFNNANLTVNYLNTPFILNQAVGVNNNIVRLDDIELKDPEGHSGIANGTVNLSNLDNPGINVVLRAQNLLALNTTEKNNPVYYGKAYGTGTFRFTGPVNNMRIDLDAKTEEGTVFNLPLNSSETVGTKDFIHFVSKDSLNTGRRETSFEGLTLNFKLRVDAGTTANIFTSVGKLSGRGNGELTLNINSQGDFEMFGDYVIESGKFDFTAQEVINKQFDIRRGGTIRWTGNPTDAQVNMKAVYALRASLHDLYVAANRDANAVQGNDRVNTEVEMTLSGLLTRPDISLDIFFPSNPAVKEDLQAYFSDINNMNLQAFSLIIRRSFAPQSGQAIGQQLSSSVTSTATELLFNQFNNVLASLNLDFVDFNIRSFNDASASFKFFNDRLIVNAGVADRRTNNPLSFLDFGNTSNLAGEIEALWLIRKDGNLVAKIANKPPTIQSVFLNSGINPYANVTSLGLIYSQQFDNFGELARRVKNILRTRNRDTRAVDDNYRPSLNLDSIARKRFLLKSPADSVR